VHLKHKQVGQLSQANRTAACISFDKNIAISVPTRLGREQLLQHQANHHHNQPCSNTLC